MIIFVAPYDGSPPESSSFLGSARKINFLLSLLAEIDNELILVNSSPKNNSDKDIYHLPLLTEDGYRVTVVTPSTSKNNAYSRIANIFQIPSITNYIVNRFGIPDNIWCYNAAAFETLFASHAKKKYGSKVILEFEDWHFARPRLSLRLLIDWIFWKKNAKNVDYGFAVNSFLKKKLDSYNVPTQLLPGVVNDEIFELSNKFPPFQGRDFITVGYFGGLYLDKGAGFLLEIFDYVRSRDLKIKFFVTGKGPLSDKFYSYSSNYPNLLKYFGSVNSCKLYEIIGQVDVILNPHELNQGVFPFKIIESIASGRLVISTPLLFDSDGSVEWLENSVIVKDRRIEDFVDAILASKSLYQEKQLEILKAVKEIYLKYSHFKLKEIIHELLQNQS